MAERTFTQRQRALLDRAVEVFVDAVTEDRFVEADEAAILAFAVWNTAPEPMSPGLKEDA